jgi:hypothetical protein
MGTAVGQRNPGVVGGLASQVARLGSFRRQRHKMTRAGLRLLALENSQALADFVEAREAERPPNDPVIKDHELPHRRVTLHDEQTQRAYARDYLPAVASLREQFARRNVRSGALDAVYEAPENGADLRTISTALEEMARRLRQAP